MSSAAAVNRLGGHLIYRPAPPLDEVVHFIWVAEGYRATTPRERILPSGALAIVINLASERFHACESSDEHLDLPSAVVAGARTRPFIIDTSSVLSTVGVHFKPGGARAFLGAASDLEERLVPLEAIWGAAARRLRERLLETSSNVARVRLVEDALLEAARGRTERPSALAASLAAFEDPAVRSVAEVGLRTGLSPKRLINLFRDEVGLGPKSYWRVRRFRCALGLLDAGRVNGAGLAAEAGYFDQPHFIREFRALAGSTPREYLAHRIEASDHVAVR